MSEQDTRLGDFADSNSVDSDEPARLGGFIEIIKGTKPEEVTEEFVEGAEKYLVVDTLSGNDLKYAIDDAAPRAKSEDTIMIMDGSKSGRVYPGEPGILGSTMASIRPHGLNSAFLYFVLEDNFNRINSATKGSAVPHTDKDVVRSLEFRITRLEEQRKIASVLHNVDQAIHTSTQLVDRVSTLKNGVGQRLFHRGTNGGETEEGWMGVIPSTWDEVEFGEIVTFSQNGIYKEKDEYNGKYPIIKMGDIFGGTVLDGVKERVYLSPNERHKYQAFQGDLVFARHAQAGWGAGDCTYVPEMDPNPVVESNMIHVRLQDGFEPMFFAQYFNHDIGVRAMKRITSRSNIKSISQSDLLNLTVPSPPQEDQSTIAEILYEFDQYLNHVNREAEKLRFFKRGLMQDLLSGEVRTHDKDIEVLDEVLQFE